MPLADDKLLTTHQAAKLLQVDPGSVIHWIDKGKVRAYRTPGGHRRLRAADLREFLRASGMFVPEPLSGVRIGLLLVEPDRKVLAGFERSTRLTERCGWSAVPDGLLALIQLGRQPVDLVVLADTGQLAPLAFIEALGREKGLQATRVVVLEAEAVEKGTPPTRGAWRSVRRSYGVTELLAWIDALEAERRVPSRR